jgi:hypothetical protein
VEKDPWADHELGGYTKSRETKKEMGNPGGRQKKWRNGQIDSWKLLCKS